MKATAWEEIRKKTTVVGFASGLLVMTLFGFQGVGHSMSRILLKSSAFGEGQMIPVRYTCDGMNVSPPLFWSHIPKKTKSIALICEDPDAPMGIWVHWVLYNLAPHEKELAEGVPPQKRLKGGGLHGMNDFRKFGYGGPCPPGGTHRYYFRLYALDKKLGLEPGATRDGLLKAMEGHILGQGQLMGRYRR